MKIKPFAALRPQQAFAKECAALPYDVMSSDEARKEVQNKPYSFLHVDKAEIDLDVSVHLYDDAVYQKAADNLRALEKNGVYLQDETPRFYFYRQVMNGRAQTGIVACASIDEYISGKIKKHELTRADKEQDRIRHVDTCSAQTGPIFLAYKTCKELDEIIQSETQKTPLYDFVADDGISHVVWASSSPAIDARIQASFEKLDALYIADGHHRAASAVRVGLMRREQNPGYNGNEEFNFFMSVIFPADSLKIFDYNRLLRDLNGMDTQRFLSAVEKTLGKVEEYQGAGQYRPTAPHTIGLYVGGKWYKVQMRQDVCQAEKQAEKLDCAILQKHLLSPVLGIDDPRTDKRIDFVGGIRGLAYLEERCQQDAVAAISMYPVTMDELTAVADAGEIMPPKSTWFEPKLRSGIFIHKIEK